MSGEKDSTSLKTFRVDKPTFPLPLLNIFKAGKVAQFFLSSTVIYPLSHTKTLTI